MELKQNALTTLDALKGYIGIDKDEDDPARDEALTQLINAASAWLETKLGRKLARNTYTQRYTAPGTQNLCLNEYPIISIGHIKDRYTGEEITDYEFEDEDEGEIGVVFREDGWTYKGHLGGLSYDYTAPQRYLEVEYTAGYVLPKDATEDDPATLPSDLEAVIWAMIAQQWAILENDASGLSAFSISDVSWTFDKELSDTWSDIISLYKRW